jgi:hypothetical protein
MSSPTRPDAPLDRNFLLIYELEALDILLIPEPSPTTYNGRAVAALAALLRCARRLGRPSESLATRGPSSAASAPPALVIFCIIDFTDE